MTFSTPFRKWEGNLRWLPRLALPAAVLLSFILPLSAGDWPMWRYDAGRTACSPEPLPAELHLQWTRHYPARQPVWDDPLNHDLMPYDRVFEPIVVGRTVYIGFNDQDKVVALQADTGKELWSFYADGPIRLPLAHAGGFLYFTSDDGCLYCLSAANGQLAWKFSGAPAPRKSLGNKRLISSWPARGGAVVKDGVVYFSASIWPAMGVFLYALDAATGRVIWKNDGTGSQYIKQPHSAFSFAGVAPQGALVALDRKLLVPGGRSVPACFDRNTGEMSYYFLNEYNKGGGAFVCANEEFFVNHTRDRNTALFRLATGDKLKAEFEKYPVLGPELFYFSGERITARDARKPEQVVWTLPVDASGDLIQAGPVLYAGGKGSLTAVRLNGREIPEVLWTRPVEGEVGRLVAAGGRLFAVLADGRILMYSADRKNPADWRESPKEVPDPPAARKRAEEILARSGAADGYALIFGPWEEQRIRALARASRLQMVVVEPDAARVQSLRRQFDAEGLGADRLAFLPGTPSSVTLAPYLSSLSVVNADRISDLVEMVRRVGEAAHPYHGKIWVEGSAEKRKAVEEQVRSNSYEGLQVLSAGEDYLLLARTGGLKGAANWTHQYGSMANTVKSDDQRVQLPLGILWFGGNSNMDVLPRHGHGPPEQIVDGKLIIEGIDCLSARDVYTGRVLWKTEFGSLGTFGTYYNESYADDPLNPFYNQEHIPGANARGTNFVATSDSVYLLQGVSCHRLDIHTGRILKTTRLPGKAVPQWGYIGVAGDSLVAGAGLVKYSTLVRQRLKSVEELAEYLKSVEANDNRDGGAYDFDQGASSELVVLDRITFREKWRVASKYGFLHNAIVSDGKRLFLLDKMPAALDSLLQRRGIRLSGDYSLSALDLATGQPIWKTTENLFGSWLGYSARHDLLLQATRPSRDMLAGEPGERMMVHQAADGRILWDRKIKYENPPILHGDNIIVDYGGYDLRTAEPLRRKDPITGEPVPWKYTRLYGCNYNIASEHLLSFRSGAAGFYNLQNLGGTGNFGGFKSGCTSNLIAANGVLNAPDYTRTCACSYQNQTSLAFVSMPELEYWTNNEFAWSGKPVERIGVNFGAPGDRMADNGTLWLDYPSVGGMSPDIPVQVSFPGTEIPGSMVVQTSIPVSLSRGRAGFVRSNSYAIRTADQPWIAASAMVGFSALELTLSRTPLTDAAYTVNLYFAEIAHAAPGERVFDLDLQERPVLRDFDIAREAGGTNRLLVRTFRGIPVRDKLRLSSRTRPGSYPALLCGIELIREK